MMEIKKDKKRNAIDYDDKDNDDNDELMMIMKKEEGNVLFNDAPHEGSIRRPIAPRANALPLSYVPFT